MDKVILIRMALGVLIGSGLGAMLGYFGKCTTGACPLTGTPWRGAIFGGLIGVLFSFSAAPATTSDSVPTARPAASTASAATAATADPLLHIGSVDEFQREVLDAHVPVLVDLYSDSCPPCRALAPTIEALAAQYSGRAIVAKVSVDRLPQLAQRYGVEAIPTVLFFTQGQEQGRLIGLRDRAAYAQVLDRLIQGT